MMKTLLLLMGLTLLSACEQQAPTANPHETLELSGLIKGPAQEGDTVLIHYTGTLPDGSIFESTEEGAARPVVIGAEQILPALEQAIIGMQAGDNKTILIPFDKAFGPHLDKPGMVVQVERIALAHSIDLEIGMRLNAAIFADENATESTITPVIVIALDNKMVTLDANHPLAGKDLNFDISLVEIESRPPARN